MEESVSNPIDRGLIESSENVACDDNAQILLKLFLMYYFLMLLSVFYWRCIRISHK